MINFPISTPLYITSAICGAVMMIASVTLSIQPEIARLAQNNVAQSQPNFYAGTPMPCLVSDYKVDLNSSCNNVR